LGEAVVACGDVLGDADAVFDSFDGFVGLKE